MSNVTTSLLVSNPLVFASFRVENKKGGHKARHTNCCDNSFLCNWQPGIGQAPLAP